jgi:hypothetical protein
LAWSPTNAAHDAKAAIPRISRSLILRAKDRRPESKPCKTLGSTKAIASENVTLDNSGTPPTSVGEAAGFVTASEASSIEPHPGMPAHRSTVVNGINPIES